MTSTPHLSNAVRITDINDFLTPSTACVLPLSGGAVPTPSPREPPGSVLAPIIPSLPDDNPTTALKARVTVSDCLTCSGCVTSADTVLLSTDSLDTVRAALRHAATFKVVGLSQQAVASVAVHLRLPLALTARKLAALLRRAGFDAVVDLSFAHRLSLLEARAEFVRRFRAGHTLTVSSACPGWVTYAEKTQGPEVLNCLSAVRSEQGMLGVVARALGEGSDVWVAAVMMCHDKKLEASRPEFRREGGQEKEVDCVFTTGELMDLMRERGFDVAGAEEGWFDEPFRGGPQRGFGVAWGSGSGGYADFVLRGAAEELLGLRLPDGPLHMEKTSKSGDVRSITVADKTGTRELRFATAYGFRSLQSILRKMRRGECLYHYIELMACPGGCNNGGGQLDMPADHAESGKSVRQQAGDHLEAVNEAFAEAPTEMDTLSLAGIKKVYEKLVGGSPGEWPAKETLSMRIESRKAPANTPSSLTW